MPIDYRDNKPNGQSEDGRLLPPSRHEQLAAHLGRGQELLKRFEEVSGELSAERPGLIARLQRMAGVQVAQEEIAGTLESPEVGPEMEFQLRTIAQKLMEEAHWGEPPEPWLAWQDVVRMEVEAANDALRAEAERLQPRCEPLQRVVHEIQEYLDDAVRLGTAKTEQNFHGGLRVLCNKLSGLRPEDPQGSYYVIEQFDLLRRSLLSYLSDQLAAVQRQLESLP